MSLLQKASIITTPTAYAEDFLYNIKPAGGLGNELVTNGTFDTDSNWNKSATFSISNGKLHCLSDGSYQYANQANVFVVGRTYKLTFEIVDYTSGEIRVRPSGQSPFQKASAKGVYTFYYTATNTTLVIERHSACDLYVDNVSVKEVLDFDFDRNSTGTRVNEDYLIEDVPYNFVTYSEDYSQSSWAKNNVTVALSTIISPNGLQNVYSITEDTSNSTHYVQTQSINVFVNKYTFSAFIKPNGRDVIRIQGANYFGGGTTADFNLTTKTIVLGIRATNGKIENCGNGWFRCSFTSLENAFAGNNAHFRIYLKEGTTYTGDGSSGVFVWGAQLVKGDQPKDYLKTTDRLDIPRIDYTNGEPSILLEPSRTNLETKSNEFSTWGVISNTTRTANYTQSPEGLNNATRLQFTANGYVANTPQILGTYTISCYAKRNDSGTQNVGFFTNGSGVVNSAWAVTSEWKRFSYTFPTLNGSYMGIAGVSGADISVYGFQIEGLVSYATSYIPTSGSTVTRSADAANNAGNSDLINSTEGVLYAEMKALADDNTDRRIAISDGTMNNYVSTGYSRFTGNIVAEIISNGVLQTTDWGATGVTQTDNIKFALSWSSSIMKFYMNGVQKQTTSMNSPTGMNNLRFSDAIGNAPMYTNVKSIMVFKEALTDLELEKLTGYNNHELYMNYYNRLSYLGLAEEYNVESDINNYIL